MKKIKWYLIATAFIGIASAFATPKFANDPVGKLGPNNFVPINLSLENQNVPGGWKCVTQSDTCRFTTKAGVPSGQSSYTRSQVDPVMSTINQKFQWIIPPPAP